MKRPKTRSFYYGLGCLVGALVLSMVFLVCFANLMAHNHSWTDDWANDWTVFTPLTDELMVGAASALFGASCFFTLYRPYRLWLRIIASVILAFVFAFGVFMVELVIDGHYAPHGG